MSEPIKPAAALAAIGLGLPAAQAHHSFPVHFVPDQIITISGVVSDFRFRNPHGVVLLAVAGEGRGQAHHS